MNGLNEAIDFINRKEMLEVISDMNAEAELDAIAEMNTKGMELDGEIKIDIDFEGEKPMWSAMARYSGQRAIWKAQLSRTARRKSGSEPSRS